MSSSAAQIYYSDKYEDEEYEYRLVIVKMLNFFVIKTSCLIFLVMLCCQKILLVWFQRVT